LLPKTPKPHIYFKVSDKNIFHIILNLKTINDYYLIKMEDPLLEKQESFSHNIIKYDKDAN
jgi:hypothetical protein